MKKTLLLLAITFTFAQQTQAQTAQELIGAGISLFGSKKQSKRERAEFVKDSTTQANIKKREKRESFVKDSIANDKELTYKKQEDLKNERTQRQQEAWDYHRENIDLLTFNPKVVGYFILENKNEKSIDIYSDSTATTKIDSIQLNKILPTEVFKVIGYNYYRQKSLLKSLKDNKIYVMFDKVMNYQNYSKAFGERLMKEYTNPQVVAQKKILLDNYRLKLNGALSTVAKLEAIHSKHMYKKVNQFGVVIEEGYNKDKFTAQEKVIYKQLILKLSKQKDSLDADLTKKIGNKETVRGLLEIKDISKQLQVEHAYTDYSYYALNW